MKADEGNNSLGSLVRVLTLLLPEAFANYRKTIQQSNQASQKVISLVGFHLLFCAVVFVSLLPTFATRYFIYGGFFKTGYVPISQWAWRSPWFLALLFSANPGLFSCTPLFLIATAGLFLFCCRL